MKFKKSKGFLNQKNISVNMSDPNKINVDEAEIQKFDQMAKEWWDPNGPMKPLHQLNPTRLQFILNHLSLTNKKMLDVGCGAGILTESLAKNGADLVGLDLSSEVLACAREHAKLQNLMIDYVKEPVEAYAKSHPQEFDAISCMELLEHVPDPLTTIKACADLVKPEGLIFFSTINRTPKAFLLTIIGAEYLLNMLPKGTHHYQKFIRPSELTSWAREAGLSLIELKGLEYHPLSGKFSLGDKLSANYLACYKKL
jgi:2-polyprenyl-6-hydroxyphenyl methylase / 3-demethylubiquinone-9 3-methyltransferase